MSRTRVPDLGSSEKLTVSGMSVNGTTVSPWARPGRVHSGNPIAAKLAAVSPVFNTSRRVIVLAMIVPLDCMKLVPAVLPSSIRGDQRGSAPKRTGAIADLNFAIITGIQKLLCKLAGIFVCIRGCILSSFRSAVEFVAALFLELMQLGRSKARSKDLKQPARQQSPKPRPI